MTNITENLERLMLKHLKIFEQLSLNVGSETRKELFRSALNDAYLLGINYQSQQYLDTATGIFLDKIGKKNNIIRDGNESDEAFRERIFMETRYDGQ